MGSSCPQISSNDGIGLERDWLCIHAKRMRASTILGGNSTIHAIIEQSTKCIVDALQFCGDTHFSYIKRIEGSMWSLFTN